MSTFECATHIISSSHFRNKAIVVTFVQSYFFHISGFVENIRYSFPGGLLIVSQYLLSTHGQLSVLAREKGSKMGRRQNRKYGTVAISARGLQSNQLIFTLQFRAMGQVTSFDPMPLALSRSRSGQQQLDCPCPTYEFFTVPGDRHLARRRSVNINR